MCLDIALPPTIAEEEIPVYKVLVGHRSPYFDFLYKPARTYYCGLGYSEDGKTIFEGFHSYKTAAAAEDLLWCLHASSEPKRIKVVRMFIPKGSIVCVGQNEHIVSNCIRTTDLDGV